MTIREPRCRLIDHPPERADAVLGRRRRHYLNPAEQRVRQLAICQAYPTWDMYHEQIATERLEAYLKGRKPHRATEPPPIRGAGGGGHPTGGDDNDPMYDGPSAAVIKRRYGTKDPI
jgi:hypothetical protein